MSALSNNPKPTECMALVPYSAKDVIQESLDCYTASQEPQKSTDVQVKFFRDVETIPCKLTEKSSAIAAHGRFWIQIQEHDKMKDVRQKIATHLGLAIDHIHLGESDERCKHFKEFQVGDKDNAWGVLTCKTRGPAVTFDDWVDIGRTVHLDIRCADTTHCPNFTLVKMPFTGKTFPVPFTAKTTAKQFQESCYQATGFPPENQRLVHHLLVTNPGWHPANKGSELHLEHYPDATLSDLQVKDDDLIQLCYKPCEEKSAATKLEPTTNT